MMQTRMGVTILPKKARAGLRMAGMKLFALTVHYVSTYSISVTEKKNYIVYIKNKLKIYIRILKIKRSVLVLRSFEWSV